MYENPEALFQVPFCSGIVPPSGAVGTPESWQKVFRGVSEIVSPLTVIINVEFPLNYTPPAAMVYSTDLRLRWGDTKGGGEAVLDASCGLVATVGGNWIEVECNHKSFCAAAGLPGAEVIVTVSGFAGTVPHPRPVRTDRFDIAAGATSARRKIPRYTYLSRVEGIAEVTPQIIIRGYQDQFAGSAALVEDSGRNPMVNCNGVDWYAIENTSPLARSVLVVHELCL